MVKFLEAKRLSPGAWVDLPASSFLYQTLVVDEMGLVGVRNGSPQLKTSNIRSSSSSIERANCLILAVYNIEQQLKKTNIDFYAYVLTVDGAMGWVMGRYE